MRKSLEMAGLTALAVLVFVTVRALFGPARLTPPIPTRFGVDGRPDSWGSTGTLVALPVVAMALYLLMTVVSRHPSVFNFPVQVTPGNRSRLESLALEMIAWLKAELVCVLVWIQQVTIESAREGHGSLSPWFMPLTLGVIFGTILRYFVGMLRAARPASES